MRSTAKVITLALVFSACGRLHLGNTEPPSARSAAGGTGNDAGGRAGAAGDNSAGSAGSAGDNSAGSVGAAGDASTGSAGSAGDNSAGSAGASKGDALGGRFASCRHLTGRCGVVDKDCCAVGAVDAGEFIVGGLDPATTTTQLSHVSKFELGVFEVTVARFQAFLASYDEWRASGAPREGAGAHPLISGSGWDLSWSESIGEEPELDRLAPTSAQLGERVLVCQKIPLVNVSPNLPANCVNFFEAQAFCLWDGGRLPTDLEWEYAAAGGKEDRIYPWGPTEPVPGRRASFGCKGTWPDLPCDFSLVGAFPSGVGKFGQLDLGGSVAEWTRDTLNSIARPIPCNDCATVQDEYEDKPRVMRGGDWSSDPGDLKVARWYTRPATLRLPYFGFRCAYDSE